MKKDSLHKLIEESLGVEFTVTGCDKIKADLLLDMICRDAEIKSKNYPKVKGFRDLLSDINKTLNVVLKKINSPQ